jgi:hypothetical protein
MADEELDTKKMVSMDKLMGNMKAIDKLRTVMFIIGGTICGILGNSGLNGLYFFVGMTTLTSIALIVKMRFDVTTYTNLTIFNFLVQGLTSSAMSFLLFWTLAFALVYIY